MDSLPTDGELLLELLTKKVCTLLRLLSGQRAQTISLLNVNHLLLNADKCVLYVPQAEA